MSWKQGQLQDLVQLQRGFDITKAEQRPGDIPVISSSGPQSYHNQSMAKGPGVVVGRKGSVGTVYYSKSDYWPHDTTLWSKDLKGNDPKYVYYFLQTLQLRRFDTGNSNPTLNRNHIHKLPIKIPDPVEQARMASILSVYDDLIDNNRRRVALLEEAARLLYREWFVRLRFPGCEHCDLINGIPVGWSKIQLSKICDTQYGYTESAQQDQIGPKFLRGTDINKNSYIDWSSVPYCKIDESDLPKYRLFKGDIVVIRMADPGKAALVESDVDAVFASYLVRLRQKPDVQNIDPLYLFYCLIDPRYQKFIANASGGATRKSASAPLLTNYEILKPADSVVASFCSAVRDLRAQMSCLLRQNEALSNARDMLIPRLMSGRLEV